MTCPTCDGSGQMTLTQHTVTCPTCGGNIPGKDFRNPCMECNGTGFSNGRRCPECNPEPHYLMGKGG